MKYIVLFLSLFLFQINAQELQKCSPIDYGGVKLYTPTTIDLSKTNSIIFGRCVDIFDRTNYLKDFRVSSDHKKNTIYVDFIIDNKLGFGYATDKELTYKINIINIFIDGVGKEADYKLVFRSKSDLRPDDADYEPIKTFAITLKSSSENPITDPTGAWYDPALDGTGFVLMQVANGSVMYFYGYDRDGKPLWLISEVIDEAWDKDVDKTFTMYRGQADANTNFTTPPQNIPKTVEWGKVTMRFDSCNSGYAKLSGVDGEQTFNLTKLAVPNDVFCTNR